MKQNQNDVNKFMQGAGLKILAVAHLNQVQYSLVLYILNTAVSGLNHLVATSAELANLIAYTEEEVRDALLSLSERNILSIRKKHNKRQENVVMQISFQFDLKLWELDVHDSKGDSTDAVVFPFRRQGNPSLKVLEGEKKNKKLRETELPTWTRIVEHFKQVSEHDDVDDINLEKDAKLLVDTHPVDQVLVLIRHFGSRIPTLSLLASSWHHFIEMFEEETQKVDLLGARSKYHELNDRVRIGAEKHLSDFREKLSSDEITVLEILIKHRHPRRQLFWAYQMKNRYPNLNPYFEEMSKYMLAVSTTGSVVKRPPKN